MRKCNWLLAIFAVLTLLVSIPIAACAKPAQFEVLSLDVTPQVVLAGDMISVATQVKNIGQREGSYSAVLNVDGVAAATQTITLLPEASQKLVFSLTEDKAGSYQVSVGELSASFKIKEPTLEQLKVDYPELYQELLKLPELTEIDEKDNEAIREIAYLALRPEYKVAFESILNEGVKDKRKYCSPLEALLWVAYDKELDDEHNLLEKYSLTELLKEAWVMSAESNYYSDKWKDFDTVISRLSTPQLVSMYMIQNIQYDYEKFPKVVETGTVVYRKPNQTFRDKRGVCGEQSSFALYCLLHNGYYYDDFENHTDRAACILRIKNAEMLHVTDAKGPISEWIIYHEVCLYSDEGQFYYIEGGSIKGPFATIEEAAYSVISAQGFKGVRAYTFLDVDQEETKSVPVK
ncbi:MAG: hypothetical protein FJ023_08535 [Chloroflexi bacterium]|nr:hypothetical protein [Chloroflexota bacterium]